MKKSLLLLAALAALFVIGCPKDATEPAGDKPAATPAKTEAAAKAEAPAPVPVPVPVPVPDPVPAPGAGPVKVVIQTNVTQVGGGIIEMELYPDKAPKSVENFVKLAEKGYYDGILFHRVVPGFVIQGGDPLTKDPAMRQRWGSGGPGYEFVDEPVKGEYVRGAVAMANAGPNTNGSQFFICTNDLTNRLPKQYNWFGMVTKGMDVVDAIVAMPRDRRDCPSTDVVMQTVKIVK